MQGPCSACTDSPVGEKQPPCATGAAAGPSGAPGPTHAGEHPSPAIPAHAEPGTAVAAPRSLQAMHRRGWLAVGVLFALQMPVPHPSFEKGKRQSFLYHFGNSLCPSSAMHTLQQLLLSQDRLGQKGPLETI